MKATDNMDSHLNLPKRIHKKFWTISSGKIFNPQPHILDRFFISHNAMLDLDYIDYSKLIKK